MRWLRLRIERLLLAGPAQRFALIALLVGAVSALGGLAGWLVARDAFDGPLDAVWWAFLRMTDPGYLGDDEGLARRAVALVVTLCGYVFFMGALVALMTTWLHQVIARLERGETPLDLDDHLLVLGWTPRTAPILREFLTSEKRVHRFLQRSGRGARGLRVVLLVEELDASVHADVALRLGEHWDPRRVTLRAGSRLRVDHLERVSFDRAAAIVLPGRDHDVDDDSDVQVLKALMSIASHPHVLARAQPPRVVAELFDQRKAALARFAYPGELDVLPSDQHLARLLVQVVRQPGLSHLYDELLTHTRGAAIYAPARPELAGLRFDEALACFDRAVLIGVVRPATREALLAPPGDLRLEPDDRAVLLAADLDDTLPTPRRPAWPSGPRTELADPGRTRHLLVLGWSARVPALLQELADHAEERHAIHLVSVVPAAEREAALATWGDLRDRVAVLHHEGDFTLPSVLATHDPGRFDHVVLLGSDWLSSDEAADARVIAGYLALREVLRDAPRAPDVLVELSDPDNATLFDGRRGEVVVSPELVSHVLAHVTLRSELLPVVDALFRAGGPSFVFRTATAYGLAGDVTFRDLQHAAWRQGHVAVGVRPADAGRRGEVRLVPASDARFHAEVHDAVVVAPVRC